MGSVSAFKDALLPASSCLVVTHNYPDPDCIAAAFGLQHLLSFWGVARVDIGYSGYVGRAENREMIERLCIPLTHLSDIQWDAYDKIILVDATPGQGNVSIPEGLHVDAVLDHHAIGGAHDNENARDPAVYYDIRTKSAATSAIVAEYVEASSLEMSSALATALFYGIKTDTLATRAPILQRDLHMFRTLFARLDYHTLFAIENPQVSMEYLKAVYRMTKSVTMFGKEIVTAHIEDIETPDYVAEAAELLSRLYQVQWVVCSGLCGERLFFSIRSNKSKMAGWHARAIAEELEGAGGGHEMASAGSVAVQQGGDEALLNRFYKVVRKVLTIEGIKGYRPFDGI